MYIYITCLARGTNICRPEYYAFCANEHRLIHQIINMRLKSVGMKH